MPQYKEAIFPIDSNFSKDPLLYNICMIKIWSALISLKFGNNSNEELCHYLNKIDIAITEIKDEILGLLLDKPEKLSN